VRRRITSVIEATTEEILQSGISCIGLLASPTTVRTRLYEEPLLTAGVTVLLPTLTEQAIIERAIRTVIAGEPDVTLLQPIIDRLEGAGAKRILLGCTELSVLFENENRQVLIDPLTIITMKLLA